jgi:hypothetical protein
MVTAMAKVIEFCVPEKFRKQSGKWISPDIPSCNVSLGSSI